VTPTVHELSAETCRTTPGAALDALDAHAAVRITGWWHPEDAASAVERVRAAEADWVSDFDAKQFALGRAWYAHLETDRTGEYFAHAGSANATVERVLPGLQQSMRDAVAAVAGGPVVQRPRWAGAGVHVFPANGVCAEVGGCVHFDHEGLTPGQRASRPPALSLVLGLQPPASGGGLRLWNVFYGAMEAAVGPYVEVPMVAGDLVVFSSYRLHQIQPFTGDRARLSATLHAARGPLAWETWF
jgi:hypothetical protein